MTATMPIPDLPEPESPRMDTRMLDFVERRREEQALKRRQRIQLVAIVALGLVGIVLTVSNAVLVSRLVARPVTPPVVAPPPVRTAAPTPAPESESSSPAAGVRSEPLAPPRAAIAPVPARVSSKPAPAEPAPAADDRPALPDRAARAAARLAPPESTRPVIAHDSLSTAVETDPALRTARWMVHTYGALDAETKALAAAQFYTGEEGEFWRRVVAHVRGER